MLLLALASIVPFRSETARQRIIDVLADRFNAEVELPELEFRLFPGFRAEGHHLVIRHRGRRDVPPLISIDHFWTEARLTGLIRRRVEAVTLEGFAITFPPKRDEDGDGKDDPRFARDHGPSDPANPRPTFVINTITTKNGRLTVLRKDPTKPARVWDIHDLQMTDIGFDRAMPFTATLENAIPPGAIKTAGSFGPWDAEQPRQTPLDGTFTFAHADLGVFKGISGILSSRGRMWGSLESIETEGETDTPDFALSKVGQPIHLKTKYRATVDGTNGNTWLNRVDASFLNTSLVATGGVVGTPGVKGRTITLDVTMEKGRVEDVMRLVIKGPQPPMTGVLTLTAGLNLPPKQDVDVLDRLQLDGKFAVAGTRFTNRTVQERIDTMSHRTSNKDDDEKIQSVSAESAGSFQMRKGTVRVPVVRFKIPGAAITGKGHFETASKAIAFTGTAETDAKISQMTSGVKSLLLKPVDLLFRREGGGASIPIQVSGTPDDPSFGLDKGRIFRRGK